MKIKYKKSLILELIIIFIVSIILTVIIMVVGISKFHISRAIYPYYSNETLIENYKKEEGYLIDKFLMENSESIYKPHTLDNKLKKSFPINYGNSFKYYQEFVVAIITSEGEVINSNTKLISIISEEDIINTQIPMEGLDNKNSDGELYSIVTFNPKNVLKVVYNKSDAVQIKEIKKLANNTYILTICRTVPTDSPFTLIAIVLFAVIFVLLSKGRLRYILLIERGIDDLYTSNFEKKILVKYNNELTSLTQAINDMAERIKENQKNEEEFLLNVSHDLRTPLTSIIGFINLLKQKKYDNEEEFEKFINILEEKSMYLKILIDEFFEFSQLKWNYSDLNKKLINIQEMLRQFIDGYYPQLMDKGLTLITNFTETPQFLEVDTDKFLRVLENILSNAIKYSSKDTEIILNLFNDQDNIVIEFWNTPQEFISEDRLGLLFQRFYKGNLARSSEGAGLGLSIALEIVKLHGGTVDAKIKDGKLGVIISL